MQQTSTYAKQVPVILAEIEKERQEQEHQPDQDGHDTQEEVIHVYPVEGGGILFTKTAIPPENTDTQEPPTPIIDSNDPTPRRPDEATTRREPPIMLYFLLLLSLFTALDNAAVFFNFFIPTVTVIITPEIKTVTTTASVSIGGDGADIRGEVLAPLTLSQEQTVTATGHGHQNATQATGSIIYFNGSFSAQTIDAGTVYTGADGIQVVIDQTVTIAAATPGNPPQFGEASVTAHARIAGASGNIPAGDINITGNTLQVRNTQFANGVNARDFTYVTKSDIQAVVSQLTPKLLQSEQAALTAQLTNGESIVTPTCIPSTSANHAPGDEAQNVTVAVSETCTSIAYNAQELHHTAITILAAHNAASLRHFQRVGEIHLSIVSQTLHDQRATITVHLASTWVYQVNTAPIPALIKGKPRLDAIHLLEEIPGVKSVSIAGVKDNEALPTDPAHIHLSVFYILS